MTPLYCCCMASGMPAPGSGRWPGACARGFQVHAFGYSSVFGGPDVAVPQLLERLADAGPLSLVGHSLGGLLALEALRRNPQLPVQRVVCLGSPLRGSGTARSLSEHGWGLALGRSSELLLDGLPDWQGRAEVGLIAGSVPHGLGSLLGAIDDASTAPWHWPRPACRGWPTIAWCAPATAAWWYRPTPRGRPRISCVMAVSTTAATPSPRVGGSERPARVRANGTRVDANDTKVGANRWFALFAGHGPALPGKHHQIASGAGPCPASAAASIGPRHGCSARSGRIRALIL